LVGWFLRERLADRFERGGFVFGDSGQEVPKARLHENLAEVKADYGQGQGFDFVSVGCFGIDEQKILAFQPAQSALRRGALSLEHFVAHLDAKAAGEIFELTEKRTFIQKKNPPYSWLRGPVTEPACRRTGSSEKTHPWVARRPDRAVTPLGTVQTRVGPFQ